MGGDRAPDEILKGCWEAVPLLGGEDQIHLVGDETVIREGLAASGLSDEQKKRFRTVATTQVIEMDESPVDAVRAKPKSSINVACDLVKRGEDDAKGTGLVKDARKLMRDEPQINFVGNVEGRDLFKGVVDVVVCDGFVGNIILKFTEGIAEGLFQTIMAELQEYAPDLLDQFKPVMKKIYSKHDWQEYGGAPLLGVGGYCLICHGRSDARAIKNAVRVGKQLVSSGVNEKIVERIAQSIPTADDAPDEAALR